MVLAKQLPTTKPAPEVRDTLARGVILAATGARYVAMATRAARSLRRHCHRLPIHLYTDVSVSDPVFDRVWHLRNPWRRSKIDSMIESPFERTLFIDADVYVTADISDLFELLERFDIALAHDQEPNSGHGTAIWRRPLPASFPQFNSGVIAFRGIEPVRRLLCEWRDAVREHDLARDQPALRELLWMSDLRIVTLPPEYNLASLSTLMRLNGTSLAPRVIHLYRRGPAGGSSGDDAPFGKVAGTAIRSMTAADWYLARVQSRAVIRLPKWRKRLLQLGIAMESLLHSLRLRKPTGSRAAAAPVDRGAQE